MSSHSLDRRGRLEAFERLCRERGVPLTVQRRVIYEAVLDHADHPTADDIYKEVRGRLHGVSRTTVYRVLETLVRLGVIGKPPSPGWATRYDKSMDRHHHLVCVRCERTVDFDDAALNRVRLPDTRRMGFTIADYSIHFMGVCQACRRSAAHRRPRSAARSRGRRKAR
ncbi:MAG TPA: Fur family transcriptional regulator [Phycisphaerae bacterium]|nr:Fur family transcriptional regulator [Phycisphaerae bacterium]